MIASHWDAFRAYLWAKFITRFILLVIVLRTNEMHNSYDQFFIPQFFFVCSTCFGGPRWRSWLRHCATSRKVAGSIPDGVIGIFY